MRHASDGSLFILDSRNPSSSSFTSSSKFKAHEADIVKVAWIPPEYGDAVACICEDGSLSVWEELVEGTQPLQWKLCKSFKTSSKVLDVQFAVNQTSLKMVAAFSDGCVKIFELLDPLELMNWQLQADFQNVIDSVSTFGKAACLTACISWNPQRGEGQESSFILGFNSNTPQLNSPKVWEFDPAHQRWLPVAELALPGDKGDPVYSVAWAPNIGRPYEVIAVASQRHVGSTPDLEGRLLTGKVALLSGHNSECAYDQENSACYEILGLNLIRLNGLATPMLLFGVTDGMGYERNDVGDYRK
ncbi:hypothetical protein REPUB_Repub07fG0183000 [Reevesia pubescens]